jgi:hypothetical protein
MILRRLAFFLVMALGMLTPLSTRATAGPPAALVRWPATSGAKAYLIEIARDRGFDQVVAKESTERPHFEWEGAEPGIYYFHIAVVDANGGVSSFSNTSVLRVLPEAPELRAPTDESEVEGRIQLRWSRVRKARSYRLQVARDKGFTKPVHDRSLPGTEATLEPLDDGRYFWRVSVVGELALESLPSLTWSFKAQSGVKLEAPKPSTPADGARQAPGEVKFRWEPAAGATSYRLVVAPAADKRFRRPIAQRELGEASATLTLPAGEHAWRVGATFAKGRETLWSEAREFTILPPPPPPPPKLREPRDGASFEAGVEVAFAWSDVPGAASYEIEIDDLRRKTRDPSFRLRLDKGAHAWRVRAGSGPWSERRDLDVKAKEAPQEPPKPEPPKAPVEVPGFALGLGYGHSAGSLVSTSEGIVAEIRGRLATTTALRAATGADARLGFSLLAQQSAPPVDTARYGAGHANLRLQKPFGNQSFRLAPFLGAGYSYAERMSLSQTEDGWTAPSKTKVAAPRASLGLAFDVGSRALGELDVSYELGKSKRLTTEGLLFVRLLGGVSLGLGGALVRGQLQVDGPGGGTLVEEKSLQGTVYLGWVFRLSASEAASTK